MCGGTVGLGLGRDNGGHRFFFLIVAKHTIVMMMGKEARLRAIWQMAVLLWGL